MSDLIHRPCAGPRRGFTLLEMLVASAIMAVLAGALFSVFSGALRLRERAYENIEHELPNSAALEIMRRDMRGIILTTGTLYALPMVGTSDRRGDSSMDTLEFGTTSGIVRERLDPTQELPFGDVQQVQYSLQPPLAQTNEQNAGLDLVRSIDRDIFLQNQTLPMTDERLLGGVSSLQFEYYCNGAWQQDWDSTQYENKAPQAVKVHIEFAPLDPAKPQRLPLDMVCEIATGSTTATQTMTTATPTPIPN